MTLIMLAGKVKIQTDVVKIEILLSLPSLREEILSLARFQLLTGFIRNQTGKQTFF